MTGPAPTIGLLEAIEDPRLLGLSLRGKQRELVGALSEGPQNAVIAAGRRGGKTTIASAVCIYDSLFRPDLDVLVRPGEVRYAVVIATNLEQARKMIESARLIAENSPVVASMLASSTADELLFETETGRAAIRAFPCSSRGVRGYPVSTFVCDEQAFFVSSDDGDQTARRVVEAVRPAQAQFGDRGRSLFISSPMGTDGTFAETWKRAHEGALPSWAAFQYTSKELNPTLSDEWLRDVELESPETFASEYLAEFASGGDHWLDRSRIRVDGVLSEAGPDEAEDFIGGLDPSYSGDSFGLALVGRRGDELVLGPVRAIQPDKAARRAKSWEAKRDAQDRMTEEVLGLCREYSARCFTDQHESKALIARARESGVTMSVTAMNPQTKHACFKALRDLLYSGRLALPDNAVLLDELARVRVKLEQGGPKIILPRSGRGHCDQVQALALACWHLRHVGAVQRQPRAGGRSMLAEMDDALPGVSGAVRDRFGVPKRLSVRDMRF